MLEVSYIGYKTQTVTIGKNTQITIKMEPDTQALEEVVVIGYGAVKKRDLTGAVSSVKNEDITLTPATNPMQALQGRVAGLDITQASGQPGEKDLNCNCVELVHLQLAVILCLLLMVCRVIILH